ncbi:MAG: hypothetical protein AAFO15_00165 [Pseudomonadota bacterium]
MLYYCRLLIPTLKKFIYNVVYFIYHLCKKIYTSYFNTISIQYIISLIILTSGIIIYLLFISINKLTIYEKTKNTFYNSLFLNTQLIEKKINKPIDQKKYDVKGFNFSTAQVLKIIEIHILKKLIVANGSYEIKTIAKHKDMKYVLINFEISLQCSFFQLIQLFDTLNKFAIKIDDFDITPSATKKSDVNISFTAPAYEKNTDKN